MKACSRILSMTLCLLSLTFIQACGDAQTFSELKVRVGDEGKVAVVSPDQVIVKGIVDMMAFVNVYISKFKADEFNFRKMFMPANGKFPANLQAVIDQIKAAKVGTPLNVVLKWTDDAGAENYIDLTVTRIAAKAKGESDELHMVMNELSLVRPGWASNIYVTKSPYDTNGKRQDYGPRTIWVGALITADGDYTDFMTPAVYNKAKYQAEMLIAARKNPPQPQQALVEPATLVVSNINPATTRETLMKKFEKFGVLNVHVEKDHLTQDGLHFAFVAVDLARSQEAVRAIGGMEIDGQVVKVKQTHPTPPEEIAVVDSKEDK